MCSYATLKKYYNSTSLPCRVCGGVAKTLLFTFAKSIVGIRCPHLCMEPALFTPSIAVLIRALCMAMGRTGLAAILILKYWLAWIVPLLLFNTKGMRGFSSDRPCMISIKYSQKSGVKMTLVMIFINKVLFFSSPWDVGLRVKCDWGEGKECEWVWVCVILVWVARGVAADEILAVMKSISLVLGGCETCAWELDTIGPTPV